MAKAVIWVVVAVVALVLLGSFVASLVGALLKLGFYLVLGLVVVGGAMYLVRKVRRGLSGADRRELR